MNAAELYRDVNSLSDEIVSVARPKSLSVAVSRDGKGIDVWSDRDYSKNIAKWIGKSTDAKVLRVGQKVDRHLESKRNAVVGGADLSRIESGQPAADCTAAFVASVGSSYGLTTAGHCDDNPYYGSYPWLSKAIAGSSSIGDLQVSTTTQSVRAQFVYTRGSLTWVKRVPTVYAGMILNRYGRNTEDSGLKIDAADSQETLDGVTYQHMAVTWSGCTAIGGDSGGPYWTGASGGAAAVGVHTGPLPDADHAAMRVDSCKSNQ